MEVLRYPHPNLFKVCKPIMVFGPELLFLLESMYETMKANNGLGLASNQVGLDYRMFVMAAPDEEKLFLVNPVITARSIALANYKEGCLSAPGEFLLLDRAAWVEVKFQNEKGEEQKRLFNAIFAVCVQHEIDHLNGKSHLESKSIPKAQRKLLAKKWGLK